MFEYHNTWPINRYFLHIYALLCFNSVRWKLFYQCICFVLVTINCDCDKLTMFDLGTIGPVDGIKMCTGVNLGLFKTSFQNILLGKPISSNLDPDLTSYKEQTMVRSRRLSQGRRPRSLRKTPGADVWMPDCLTPVFSVSLSKERFEIS